MNIFTNFAQWSLVVYILMAAFFFVAGALFGYYKYVYKTEAYAAQLDRALYHIKEQDKQLAIYRKRFAKEVNHKNEHY